jgi:hypothetical protein
MRKEPNPEYDKLLERLRKLMGIKKLMKVWDNVS